MSNFLNAAEKPRDIETKPKVPLSLVFMIQREARDAEKVQKGETGKRKSVKRSTGRKMFSYL